MFGIGESELALILLFAFLIFGPDKLPGMGRTIGRALRQFRNAQEGFTQVVQTEIVHPATEAMSDAPKKPNRKRSEEEDADIEGSGSSKSTPKTETFAERKKRLGQSVPPPRRPRQTPQPPRRHPRRTLRVPMPTATPTLRPQPRHPPRPRRQALPHRRRQSPWKRSPSPRLPPTSTR